MRKIWIIAVAAAAVALAGCNRELDAPVAEAGVFRATIETPTRVSFTDEGVFSWQAGDAIAVSTNAGFKTFTLTGGAGTANGTFEGELVSVTSATAAIYPAAIAKDDATVTLPAEYAWAEGQSNAALYCQQVSLTGVNSFKHLGGIIKIAYNEIPADADALVLTAGARITGDFPITDGAIAVSEYNVSQVKVTFAAGSNPAAFYIPVPTGEIKFQVELQKDGATIDGTLIATSQPITVSRRSLILMDPIGGTQEELLMEIGTADEFLAFVGNGKKYAATDEVKLTADIELPETFAPDTLWCSIDGQGHKVTYALDIPKESDRSAGLFTYVNPNLSIRNLKVAGSLKSAKVATGGIGGKCASNVTFENCESAVNILAETTGVIYHLGGIAGDAATGAVFRGCHNMGNIVYRTPDMAVGKNCQIGGIVGQLNGAFVVENCVNDGTLEHHAANEGTRIAGICGYVNDAADAQFINCTNNGEVFEEWKRDSGYAYIGGISGYYGTPVAGCKVLYSGCKNNGKLYAYGNANIRCRIGGIASYVGMTDTNATAQGVPDSGLECKFIDCVNNGEISNIGTNSANHIGGIIGFAETAAKVMIDGCVQNGKISQAGAGRVGGMLGMRGGTQSTFENFTVTGGTVLEVLGAGDIGLVVGSQAQYTTAMTGKVGAATVSENGTPVVMAAENYQGYILGIEGLGEGGSTTGVVFDGAAVSDFSGGSGTEADPYLIKTADDLVALSEKVNNEETRAKYASACYRQLADIDMAGVAYVPAGEVQLTEKNAFEEGGYAFSGTYDGYGKQILNLKATHTSRLVPASIFAHAIGATFKNIVLKDVATVGDFVYIGGITGIAENCTFTGCSVIGGNLATAGDRCGAFAAYMNGGKISSCTVSGLTIESTDNIIGGFIGEMGQIGSVTMEDCTLENAVIGGKQNVGGLVGWLDTGELKNCVVKNSQIVASGDGIGGLVGRGISKNGTTNLIDNCLVKDVLVKGKYTVAGLMGYAYPDEKGPVLFYNSGIINTTLEATANDDKNADPTKGDSMIAGICGWPRCSDSGSTFKAVNCFLHFAPGGLICDMLMVNASAAGFTGYMSVSAAGSVTVQNCVTNLGANDMMIGGAPVSADYSTRFGALFAHSPNDRTVDYSHNYCVTGLPMYGVKGSKVTTEGNEAFAPGELGSAAEKLNAFAASYTDYPLKSWKVVDGLPVLE